jgi:hypothetical protein
MWSASHHLLRRSCGVMSGRCNAQHPLAEPVLRDSGPQGGFLAAVQVTPAGCALGLGLGTSYNANSGTVRALHKA